MCAVRTLALAMMEVSYWNGLQMLQYSSVFAPMCRIVELIGVRHIVVPLIAVILPEMLAARSLSPMLGTEEGGMVNTVLFGLVSVNALLPLPK